MRAVGWRDANCQRDKTTTVKSSAFVKIIQLPFEYSCQGAQNPDSRVYWGTNSSYCTYYGQ